MRQMVLMLLHGRKRQFERARDRMELGLGKPGPSGGTPAGDADLAEDVFTCCCCFFHIYTDVEQRHIIKDMQQADA